MIRRPPRSTPKPSSAASDVYKRQVLEKDNAVEDFRKLIGSTDPNEAEEGTIRKSFARSKGENAVHGSDSDENANIEISFHFDKTEIFS